MLAEKRLFVFDMDGTIYLGDKFIPGAVELFEALRLDGRDFLFLTNNSSKSAEVYSRKLTGMGYPVDVDRIFTSGEATRIFIKRRKPNARIFLLGNEFLKEEFERDGFHIVSERGSSPDYVVLGFDTTLTYDKIWFACDFIKSGVEYLATHPDLVCPLPGGASMPDAGSMIKMIEAATGGATPLVLGKPNRGIIDSVIEKYGAAPEEMLMVGDRLYTDMMLGRNAGIDTALVLTGEATLEDLKNSDVEPTYVFDSVADMTKELK